MLKKKYYYTYNTLIKNSKPSGWWDYVFRNRVTRIVAYYFINFTEVDPNKITLVSFLTSVMGGAFFATGQYWGFIIGAISFEIGQILDGVDGLIARVKSKSTPSGAYMDFFMDRIRNVMVMLFIGVGQLIKEGEAFSFVLLFLYVGLKKIYLVSQLYQEKILKDFCFEYKSGKKLLLKNTDKECFLNKYISFTNNIGISPYYTDLDTDFLTFVFFPMINMIDRGLIYGSILLLFLIFALNLFFFKVLK